MEKTTSTTSTIITSSTSATTSKSTESTTTTATTTPTSTVTSSIARLTTMAPAPGNSHAPTTMSGRVTLHATTVQSNQV